MTINGKTPISQVINKYPQLIERILERNPRFEYLKLVGLSCGTICDRHTVSKVATVMKEDEDEFIAFLKKEIELAENLTRKQN